MVAVSWERAGKLQLKPPSSMCDPFFSLAESGPVLGVLEGIQAVPALGDSLDRGSPGSALSKEHPECLGLV